MHAVRLHAFGPAENLTYEQVDIPSPAPGQVRIAVAAAGVHLLDTVLRRGERGPLPGLPELPTIPGREVAGVIESLGEGVAGLWLGKRVVAHLGFAPGGYAESAVVDVDRVHEIPGNLDFAQAVAMIGTGRTAMGIVQFSELDGDSVAVVPAAAGGLGTLLVQYAKHAGATVIGLAGDPEKVALAQANGADLALDYSDPEWPGKARAWLGGRPATVVFDGVGGEVAREAVGLLGDATRTPRAASRLRVVERGAVRRRRAVRAGARARDDAEGRRAESRPDVGVARASPRRRRGGSCRPCGGFRWPRQRTRTGHWRHGGQPERWCWSRDQPQRTRGCDTCRFMVF